MKAFIKDLTMAIVGIVTVVFGAVIALSPSIPYIRVLGGTLAFGGFIQIIIGRDG